MVIPSLPLPPPARDPSHDGGRAELLPRYEDVAQDGRIILTSLAAGLTHTVWHGLLADQAAPRALAKQGVLPILHRMVIVAEDRSVSANLPIRFTGGFRYARQKDGERLFLNMWVDAHAQVASTIAPRPPADAPYEPLARIFAEHVITRPFAPAGERKVTRLDAPGVPPIPEDEYDLFAPAEALLARAAGELEPLGEVTFGLVHTDSNQHVNSMVYPRVFEEHVIRRLVARDPSAARRLARAVDIVWQKPFFAGQTARTSAHFAEDANGAVHAVGAFHGAGDKPHTTVAMTFR
ncbi:MAG: hypothetical protein JWP97_5887 [Labilithrix sp.]|nr:hypothetical protein [Labilithrix sp.]